MRLTVDKMKQKIHLVRSREVILDSDLAEFFQTKTKSLNLAASRNANRFSNEDRFQLTADEFKSLSYRNSISKKSEKVGWGGRRYLPYVFSKEAVLILSGILKSDRAIEIKFVIMRAFVSMRKSDDGNLDLADRVKHLEEIVLDQQKNIINAIQHEVKALHHRAPVLSLPLLPAPGSPTQATSPSTEAAPRTYKNRHNAEVAVIQNAVTQYYQISLSELKSSRRMPSLTIPRQLCMYLMRKYLNLSYKQIGEFLGNKDHSTVLHACRKIELALVDDQELQEALESISYSLQRLHMN